MLRPMDNAWQRYLEVVSGVTQLTQRRAEEVVRALVRRGEIEASKGEKTVEGLLSRVEQNRKAVASIVRSEMDDAVRRMGLARQSDIDRLQAKIARLEAELRGAKKTTKKAAPSKKAAKKSAAAKSTAKKSTKKRTTNDSTADMLTAPKPVVPQPDADADQP